jgi:DNA polymerase-3 subunit gamma/tau
MSLADVRGLWPTVIDACRSLRKATWSLVGQNAQVVDFDGTLLTLGFPSAGLRDQFLGGGHEPVLGEAIMKAIGLQPRLEAIVHQGGSAPSPPPAAAAPPAPPEPEPPVAPEPPTPRRPRMADIKAEAEEVHDPDAAVDRDDADVDAESGADLLARELGAQVIEEIPHS